LFVSFGLPFWRPPAAGETLISHGSFHWGNVTLALIEAEEAGQAAEAERSRVAHLMTGYRDRLGRLVQAIESGNDAMAPYRIQVAEAELAEVCLQIPPKSRPPAFVVQNPSMIVLDPAMRLGFLETICHAGFAELLPKDIGLGFSSTTNEGTIEENKSVWVGTAKPAARLPTIRSFQTKCLGFRAVRRRWHTDKNSSCFQEAGRGSPFS
jgi:hypothetical protein